ncbi:signal peptidase I [Nonomuraea turcica]|uniref:signal peptidase I n=1 Tax=Nonomuraea sp. G32 TaxID=3067274 RepID=UPI0035303545
MPVHYRTPQDWTRVTPGNLYISRVIGVPGDRVTCCDDPKARLQVNGAPLDEAFVTRGPASYRWFDIKVPQNRIWIMSDNRHVVLDSRAQMDKAGGPLVARTLSPWWRIGRDRKPRLGRVPARCMTTHSCVLT